ncbi:MAG: hypothetical protein J7527_12220 [Chitinophagaceae bacterium]|nr:hypothetical protein [Chitinophagaceae bacterium]
MTNNNQPFSKAAGIALLVFAALLLFTMVLHPAGSNVPGLIRMSALIILTHSAAILAMPVGWAGFLGVTRYLGPDRFMSVLGFSFISIGIIAAMLAGTINGVVLPLFLRGYADASDEVLDSLKPVIRYSFSVNMAFDYIYTGAFSLGIACWSVLILQTKRMQAWIGVAGVLLAVAMIAIFFGGIASASKVMGLRIFLAAVLVWTVIAAIAVMKKKE